MALQALDRYAPTRFPTTSGEDRIDDTLLLYSGIDGEQLAQSLMVFLSHQPATYAGVLGSRIKNDQSNTVVSWWSLAPCSSLERVTYSPSKPLSASTEQAWFRTAHTSRGPLSMEQVGQIFDGLNELLHQYRFRMIDEAFESTNLPEMSVDAIVVFARSTYRARERLSGWRAFVDRAREELARRGEDGVLSGL
jgi:hypothetical protein